MDRCLFDHIEFVFLYRILGVIITENILYRQYIFLNSGVPFRKHAGGQIKGSYFHHNNILLFGMGIPQRGVGSTVLPFYISYHDIAPIDQ